MLKNDSLKLVTVKPARPFRLGAAHFTSVVQNIILSCGSISYCLQEKALVTENLANGKQVALDFTNYNTDNGPSAVPEDAVELVTMATDPVITVTDLDGNKTVINNRTVIAPKVKHIDLESEKLAKEQAEKEAAAKEALKKAKAEAAAKEAEEEAKRKKYEEEKRKEALKEVYAREDKNKKKEEKKVESFTVTPVKEEKKEEAPAVEVTKEATVTATVEKKEEKKDNSNNQQQNKDNKWDNKNNKNHK